MQTLLASILLYLIASSVAIAQTWTRQNPLPTNERMVAIHFIDSQIGWAIGDYATLLHTTDGGTTWDRQFIDHSYTLHDVYFADALHGWLACEYDVGDVWPYGRILYTSDGGQSWSIQLNEYAEMCYSISFIDSNNGWIADYYGRIHQTTNGGLTWITQNTNQICLRDITFLDSLHGWAVGALGLSMHTIDGGNTWLRDSLGSTNILMYGVTFVDTLYGWSVGVDHSNNRSTTEIFHTTNGGLTWNNQISDTLLDLQNIRFFDRLSGLAAGSITYDSTSSDEIGRLLRTSNGGVSWEELFVPSFNGISNTCFLNPDTGWIASGITYGCPGDVQRTTDGGHTWVDLFSGPKVDLRDIDFINLEAGIAIEYFGRLIRTSDSGTHWEYITNDTMFYFKDLYFLDEQHGWAIGTDIRNGISKVMFSSDFGRTWSVQTSTTALYLKKMSFSDANHGWIAGIYLDNIGNRISGIQRTTDGGLHWSAPQLQPSIWIDQIQFVDSLHGWCVGSSMDIPYHGTITRTTDGGVTWHDLVLPSRVNTLIDLDFINPTVGWVVGYGAQLDSMSNTIFDNMRTTDGGESWQIGSTGAANLYSVTFFDSTTGWAAGMQGRVVHTTDGGASWYVNDTLSYSALNKICFIDRHHGWVAGEFGTIFRYDEIDDGVVESESIRLPSKFTLSQNYPNPFNATTTISYTIPKTGRVELKLFDLLGREVQSLVDETQHSGSYRVTFDGSSLASGIYFYRLHFGNITQTKRMVVLK